ncbi:MAG: DUF3493 domain-containing protein [Cyanobacteria bacterium P01_A01_bin.123]
MPDRPPQPQQLPKGISPEKFARLRAEAKAPYRSLRRFIYGAFTISGFLGAFVFLAQLLAGRDVASAAPNFALQAGLVALMIWLFRIDKAKAD